VRPSSEQSGNQSSEQWLTVREAAEHLGITVDAVRSRIRRGTLRRSRGPNGEVVVALDDDPSTDQSSDQLHDQMQDQIDYLRRQLEVWQEEARRKDHIIAALAERIPAIEAPSEEPPEPRDGRVTASDGLSKGTGRDERGEAEKPSWWKRLFGLE
jgi:hypothetical protein